jgi:hypothetical protein
VSKIKTSLLIDSTLWSQVKLLVSSWAKDHHLPQYGATGRWVASILQEVVKAEQEDKDRAEGKGKRSEFDVLLDLFYAQLDETLATRIVEELGVQFGWGEEEKEIGVTLVLGQLGKVFEEKEKEIDQ